MIFLLSNDHKAKHETESAAIEAVAKNTKIDIPSGMIETETDNMINCKQNMINARGGRPQRFRRKTQNAPSKWRKVLV